MKIKFNKKGISKSKQGITFATNLIFWGKEIILKIGGGLT